MHPIASLVCLIPLLGVPTLVNAAGSPRGPATADIRWICQQPTVARIRITGLGLQTPEKPCATATAAGADPLCRVAVVYAIVLESLPRLGAQSGLPTADSRYPAGPWRFQFRLASRDYRPIKTPSLDLVGMEGLIAMPETTGSVSGDPGTLPPGVFVPTNTPRDQGLDMTCKPFRHWSGQARPDFPETLPGTDPLALDAENELAKALASLIAFEPPSPADIESHFGVRMLPAISPMAGRRDDVTLVRLPQRWIQIRRQSWLPAQGRAHVQIKVQISPPLGDQKAEPWWYVGYGNQPPELGYCITPWMIFNALGPDWIPPPPTPYVRLTERNPEAPYKVDVMFPSLDVRPMHGPSPPPYSPYRCSSDIYISYEERP